MSSELLNSFSPSKKAEVVEEAEHAVGTYLSSISEAQRELAEIIKGKSILLIDSSEGVPQRILGRQVEKLKDTGFGALPKLVIEKIFGGKIPENSLPAFQQFLGKDINLIRQAVSDTPTLPGDKISAIIFSGSPADISKIVSNPEGKIHKESDLTHNEVFSFVKRIYGEAAKNNIPMIGICYGHQALAAMEGGNVVPMDKYRKHYEPISAPPGSLQFLGGVFADPVLSIERKKLGVLPVSHGDKVLPNPERSVLLMRASESNPSIVEGLLHMPGLSHKFVGDPQKDAAMVHSLLEDKKGAAKLGIQPHPEISSFYPMMNFSLTGDSNVFKKSAEEDMAADTLRLISSFFKMHNSFRS